MSADPPRLVQRPRTRPRVHGDRFADDEAVGDHLADCLAGVGVGDFVDFVWVEPNLSFAAPDHRGREALLRAEVDPNKEILDLSELLVGMGGEEL